MNILNLLSQNLGQGSRTRTPDETIPYPTGYRGRLNHDATLCTACGTCVYACSPSAITRDDHAPEFVVWNYAEDRCTFCGFCVDYCPTHALSFEQTAPAAITERAAHYLAHQIDFQPCADCGQPFIPLPEATLIRLYGEPLPEDVAASRLQCDRCRKRAVGQRFRAALVGK